jgi:hypothetical protein
MGIRDRSNGPSMGEATYKADRGPAPSPERRQAARLQVEADAAKRRHFLQTLHNEPDVWYEENFEPSCK